MSDPERVVVRLRPHGRVLVLPVLLLVALAFGATFALGRVDWPLWDAVVLGVAAVLAIVVCLVPLLAWGSRRVIVTTRRIIVRGAFGGSKRDVPLTRIHDVTLRRRGTQMIFGTGDVLLSTGGDQPVTLPDLPRAGLAHRAISELVGQTPATITTREHA